MRTNNQISFHLENGRIQTLKIGSDKDIHDMISIIPFFYLADRYDGWLMNIIGNIIMFIPVGIVWPVCFSRRDSMKKTILAGAGFTFLIEVSQLFCIGRHTDVDEKEIHYIFTVDWCVDRYA